MKYTKATAGMRHTVLLRSNGTFVFCGDSRCWKSAHIVCNRRCLETGLTYVDAAAGEEHTVLVRSDGAILIGGNNCWGQCDIPACRRTNIKMAVYTQVAAGSSHTVLLRSDGTAIACGANDVRQCDIPPLEEGLTYRQVAAGGIHTVLLRSDGVAVACGDYSARQCRLPPVNGGLRIAPSLILLLTFDGISLLHVKKLSGEDLCEIEARRDDRLAAVRVRVLDKICVVGTSVELVMMPGGELVSPMNGDFPLYCFVRK